MRLVALGLLLGIGTASAQQTISPSPFANGAEMTSQDGAASQTPEAAKEVHASLVADTKAIEPGQPFRLGVLLKMEPGWHVYWRNNGDIGLPTQVDWRLPQGFSAGPLQWPTPERIVTDDDDPAFRLVSYGYHDAILLWTVVTPPAQLDPQQIEPLQFAAQVNWVACKELCVPGEALSALELPAGRAEPSAEAELFRRYAELTPAAWGAEGAPPVKIGFNPDPLRVAAQGKGQLQITIEPQAPWQLVTENAPAKSGLALFPYASGPWKGEHAQALSIQPEKALFETPINHNPDRGQAEGSQAGRAVSAVLQAPLINRDTKALQVARVEFALPVMLAGETAAAAPAPATPAKAEPTGAGTGDEKKGLSFLQGSQGGHPLWYYLLLAFAGGLLLNVMPCVLPVLSLKVLGFVRQAGESRKRLLELGLMFGLGVLASFALLAALVIGLKGVGVQVGWGFQFQEPRFVLLMGAIILALSLSLLGVFSIDLPGSAANKMDDLSRREGLGGAFMNGVLITALATPCTAPLLGAALGFALAQSAWVIVLIFLTIGLGLALPYVLLAANPGWMRLMPKPGHWMETFKHAMGFALLGTLIWLIAVLGGQSGVEGITRGLIFLLAVAVACWIWGRTQVSARIRRPKTLLAMAAGVVMLAYFVFPEQYLRSLQGVPAKAGGDPVRVTPVALGGAAWEPFSVGRAEELVRQGRTVFVDFTAEWCLTCKVNKRVLEGERVQQAFKKFNVATLRADWTARDDKIGQVLSQLGASGVPFYVIFPAGRPERPLVLPTLISANLIEQRLSEVAQPAS